MDIYDSTRTILHLWGEHRLQGKRKGFDERDDWLDGGVPDFALDEVTEWVRQDNAWRLIAGVQLANQAINDVERGDL